jgi:transposase
METVLRFVGIDVCKLYLDAFCEGLGKARFANDVEGLQSLLEWLGDQNAVAGLEATGSYHCLAAETLAKAGLEVHVYNPRQIRDLAKGMGVLVKTDRVDAKVICACLKLVGSPFVARSETGKELRDVSRQIQYLIALRSDFKKKLQVPGLSLTVADSIKRQVRSLDAEIKELERKWKDLLEFSPLHKERFELLLSVPRIGIKTARVITSELPEDLSRYSRKQLAAYFGLVPYDRQSGDSVRRSVLLHGNPRLRQPLFCCATLAAHSDPECYAFAQRLKGKGKHHLTIVCAVMHKLARRAISVLLRGTPWEEEKPMPA